MLQSMTGYGDVTLDADATYVQVTLKTLNSKYLDVQFYLPKTLAPQESIWRKSLGNCLKRGKVTLEIIYHTKKATMDMLVHEPLLRDSYKGLGRIASELGADTDVFGHALALARAVDAPVAPSLTKQELAEVHSLVDTAMKTCLQNRQKEGRYLKAQLIACLGILRDGLKKIGTYTPKRTESLRSRLNERIALRDNAPSVDSARWEQEVLYYLEKMDIEEEKTRLASHFAYFEQVLEKGGTVGKKLTFIAQEIGRELNTVASKAQDSLLQHMVVDMKQALEQIKEQVQNIV